MKTLIILSPPLKVNAGPDSASWTSEIAQAFKGQPFMRIACDVHVRHLKESIFGQKPASDLTLETGLEQGVCDFVMGFSGGNGALIVTRSFFDSCVRCVLNGTDGTLSLSFASRSHSVSKPACVAIQFGLRGRAERIARLSSTYTLAHFERGDVYEQILLDFRGEED